MRTSNIFKLVAAIVVSELAGIVGAFFTVPSIATWYASLNKPALNPPAWVFGPVWTLLYLLMGISLFLIWKKEPRNNEIKIALGMFFTQLVLNVLWTISFFGLHNPGLGLANIIILWVFIAGTIVAFHKISRAAAYLLLPYIIWVSFALYLNYAIFKLN